MLPKRKLALLVSAVAVPLALAGAAAVRHPPGQPARERERDPVAATAPRAPATLPAVAPGGSSAGGSGVSPSGSASASAPKPFVVVAGGDVNLGRECGDAILADPTYDPFRFVEPLFAGADLRFANLESQLSDQNGETQSPRNRLIFTGPPGGAETLAHAGFQVVSTANNHAWDYGRDALLETLDNLARAKVLAAGTGRTVSEAYAPKILALRGKRVAIVAVTHIWNVPPFSRHEGRNYVAWAREERLVPALERARREADIVLLSYHGGAEYQAQPMPGTRRLLTSLARRGLVDAVIGHHPHVPQGVAWGAGRPILYSLGNFVFAGHDWARFTNIGVVARLSFEPGRRTRVWACPVGLDGHVPKPIPPDDPRSNETREHLVAISAGKDGSRVGPVDANGCFELEPLADEPTLPADAPASHGG